MGTLIGALIWLALIFVTGFAWWKIVKKTGYHPALGLLMLLPLANIVMLLILAFKPWPIQKEPKEGAKPATMSTPLAVLIVAVASIPLLLIVSAIAIPNFLRARSATNDTIAEAAVKNISRALETYADVNGGKYPSSENDLRAYLPESYGNKVLQGYIYALNLKADGYEISAKPAECLVTGTKLFKASTGGQFTTAECK